MYYDLKFFYHVISRRQESNSCLAPQTKIKSAHIFQKIVPNFWIIILSKRPFTNFIFLTLFSEFDSLKNLIMFAGSVGVVDHSSVPLISDDEDGGEGKTFLLWWCESSVVVIDANLGRPCSSGSRRYHCHYKKICW